MTSSKMSGAFDFVQSLIIAFLLVMIAQPYLFPDNSNSRLNNLRGRVKDLHMNLENTQRENQWLHEELEQLDGANITYSTSPPYCCCCHLDYYKPFRKTFLREPLNYTHGHVVTFCDRHEENCELVLPYQVHTSNIEEYQCNISTGCEKIAEYPCDCECEL